MKKATPYADKLKSNKRLPPANDDNFLTNKLTSHIEKQGHDSYDRQLSGAR